MRIGTLVPTTICGLLGVLFAVSTSAAFGDQGVATLYDGIYTGNVGSAFVLGFNPAGFATTAMFNPALPELYSIAVDSLGNVYCASLFSVQRFGPTGAYIGPFESQFGGYQRIAFDNAGNLYESLPGSSGHEIERISPTGVDLGVFATVQAGDPLDGMAFNRFGNLFVIQRDDQTIHEFSRTGADMGVFATAGANSRFTAMATDRSGNVYVGKSSNINEVHKFGPNGNDLGTFVNLGNTNEPYAMTFDTHGNLYVAPNSPLKYSP